jgi:hypothetical protein
MTQTFWFFTLIVSRIRLLMEWRKPFAPKRIDIEEYEKTEDIMAAKRECYIHDIWILSITLLFLLASPCQSFADPYDVDADGTTDIAVWRPESGTWYILPSADPATYAAIPWGLPTDKIVPGDYDGDGKTDIAAWRPSTGTWYVLPSAIPGSYTAMQWGLSSDVPVPNAHHAQCAQSQCVDTHYRQFPFVAGSSLRRRANDSGFRRSSYLKGGKHLEW